MGRYNTGAFMCGSHMVVIQANSIIPNEWIYRIGSSKRRANKIGNVRIGLTPIARDIYIESWWRRIRNAEYCLIGPLKWVAWGGEWHEIKGCLLGIYYWQECYSLTNGRVIGQGVISMVGITEGTGGIVNNLLIVPKGWTNELQE
jgi:hypothetical protein